jgi:dGTPase
MGVGEGDFHRTRLTHSIEAAQIGEGLLDALRRQYPADTDVHKWLPSKELLSGACLAHDLGHPPFGYGGEEALHRHMIDDGGFEGNGHTLRILTRLEKYRYGQGMNPTRRFLLAVLKYPAPYSAFDPAERSKPLKCYFDSEAPIVDWALRAPFATEEVRKFTGTRSSNGRPKHRTLDSSIMEFADDIAYGVHDLEDIIARRMVTPEDVRERLRPVFGTDDGSIGIGDTAVSLADFDSNLWHKHVERKKLIGKLVHLFITSVRVEHEDSFEHPLLRLRVGWDEPVKALLKKLKRLTYDLVIQQAEVQQLERRGQMVIDRLFCEFIKAPEKLIPRSTWEYAEKHTASDSKERKVCDYIAGMTDSYANKIYHRLFTPGQGSSHDEL